MVPGGRERTEREEQSQRQIEAMQRKGGLRRPRRFRQSPAWMSGMGIWQPDMLNIGDGVHSALLAKERVKLIDGLKHHETMGTRNFIWITL